MKNKNKGQILGITGLVIGGMFTLFASVGGAWVSAGASVQKEISKVNTVVQVVKTTEELHYKELKEDTKEIKKNLENISSQLQILINK